MERYEISEKLDGKEISLPEHVGIKYYAEVVKEKEAPVYSGKILVGCVFRAGVFVPAIGIVEGETFLPLASGEFCMTLEKNKGGYVIKEVDIKSYTDIEDCIQNFRSRLEKRKDLFENIKAESPEAVVEEGIRALAMEMGRALYKELLAEE